MKRNSIKQYILEYLLITAGSFILATGLVIFQTPAKLAAGGVSGISIILYHLFGFDPGYGILILSIPIFFFGVKIFGKQYGLRSLYGTVSLSLGVTLFGYLFGYEGVLPYIDKIDTLLSALFGGVLMGAGLGIVMKGGANTGGTDILAQIIHKYTRLPQGTSLLLVDGLVILAAALVFSVQAALFAVITVFTTAQVVNLITSGANYAKMAYIISDRYEQIRAVLLNEVGIGGTSIFSQGMYTDRAKNLILTVVRNRRIAEVSRVVKEIDPDAFMIITNATEVLGEGFTSVEAFKKKL